MKRHGGFTLVELMIVIAVIAIVAAIAVPNLVSARLASNETAAVATLRTVSCAQSQFRAGARVDLDGDGEGEYGWFRELSGASALRTAADGTGGDAHLNPPVLSGTFRADAGLGLRMRSGYAFRIRLPAQDGFGVTERADGVPAYRDVDADLAEVDWNCYAWPQDYARSGVRTFFISQDGDLLMTDDADPRDGFGPYGGAAYVAGGDADLITGDVATGTVGRDGLFWRPVN